MNNTPKIVIKPHAVFPSSGWVVLFMLICSFGYGTEKNVAASEDQRIDSLKNLVSVSIHDTTRIRIWNEIGWAYLYVNLDSAGHYGEMALQKGNQLLHTKELGTSYELLGGVYDMRNDAGKALEYYHMAMKLMRNGSDKSALASLLNNVATYYDQQNNTLKALEYYFEAGDLFTKLNMPLAAGTVHNNIGMVYQKRNLHEDALRYFDKAGEQASKAKDRWLQAAVAINKAHVYNTTDRVGEAIKHFHLGLNISNHTYPALEIDAKFGLASLYESTGQSDSVLSYLASAIRQAQAAGFSQNFPEYHALLYSSLDKLGLNADSSWLSLYQDFGLLDSLRRSNAALTQSNETLTQTLTETEDSNGNKKIIIGILIFILIFIALKNALK